MPLEHLLRHVLLEPLLLGAAVALLLPFRRERAWPEWIGLAWAAALAFAVLRSTSFSSGWPPSAMGALPFAALLFAAGGLFRMPGPASGWSRVVRDAATHLPAALGVSWLIARDVREYYGWGPFAFLGVILLAGAAGAASVSLHLTLTRSHPAPAPLLAWLVLCLGVSVSLLFGRFATGLEFAAILAVTLGPAFLVALVFGRQVGATALAAPVAGAVFAVLLIGVLHASLIWISAALLALLLPASGLLRVRSRGLGPLLGAILFVTALPAAAAIFMSFMRASVGTGPGGGS